jgi:Fic family protein
MAQRTTENKDGQEKGFILRSYGYAELALLYFPNSTKKSATSQLRRWIRRNGELRNTLAQIGFAERQRILTPRQVEVVVQFVGEP